MPFSKFTSKRTSPTKEFVGESVQLENGVRNAELIDAIYANPAALRLLASTWPDHFGNMFDMGLNALTATFKKYPDLMVYFQFKDRANWQNEDKIRRVVLGLEQTFVQAVSVFGESNPEEECGKAMKEFEELLEEIGGLHRAIVPNFVPELFTKFLNVLPSSIINTICENQETNMDDSDRQMLLQLWEKIAAFMEYHLDLGWKKRVIPKTPKLAKALKFEFLQISQSGSPLQQRRRSEEPQLCGNRGCVTDDRRISQPNLPSQSSTQEVVVNDVDIVVFSFLCPEYSENEQQPTE